MLYDVVPGIDNPVSKIIFGCCNNALIEGANSGRDILDKAYQAGFTAFDTARVYGKAEYCLGLWMEEYGIRKHITVITKGCHPSEIARLNVDSLSRDIDTSLSELKTDYIDVFLLHRDAPEADIESLLIKLDSYVKTGVIHKIGVSNWTHRRIEKANNIAAQMGLTPFSISSPQLSCVRQINDPWGNSLSISFDRKALDWYISHPEITLFTYSALAHGFLSGKVKSHFKMLHKNKLDHAAIRGYWDKGNIRKLAYIEQLAKKEKKTVSQIALAAVIQGKLRTFPIVTASEDARIKEDVEAFDVVFTPEEMNCLWTEL